MMNLKVDAYISDAKKWGPELEQLREIIADCPLEEEWKWSSPVYTWQGKNIVGLGIFNEYCGLGFFKGALLSDPEKILVVPGTVQSGRQIRFTNVKQIKEIEPIIKAYIYEAIDVEKAGIKIVKRTTEEYPVPDEFQDKLDNDPVLKAAFEALTPGRQRGYLFWFAQPKLSKTRQARVEKYIPQILEGRGLND